MKKIYLFLLLIYSLGFRSQCIENLGPDDFNQASLTQSLYTDITINSSNEIYIAYNHYITLSNPVCIVKKYSNNKWSQVGNPIPGSMGKNQISIASNGTPFVSILVGTNSIYTYKFNGVSWINIGNSIPNVLVNSEFHMELDNINTPYVVFNDNTLGSISVMKYDGTNWVYVGSGWASSFGAENNSIAFDSGGTPYVACGQNNSIAVKKFVGSNWTSIGSTSVPLPTNFSSYVRYKIKVRLNSLDELYLAYESPTGVLLKFDGVSWGQVGGFFSNIALDALDMDFDSSNNIFLSYEENNNAHKVSVSKYNGSSWSFAGNQGFSTGIAKYSAIAINNSGTPFVICQDADNMERATVRMLNVTAWDILGGGAISDARIDDNYALPSMSTYRNGDTYIAYSDATTGLSTVVKKFNGISWNILGQAPINSTVTLRHQLVTDYTGTPYLLHEEVGTDATIKKFDGTNWTNIGGPNSINGSQCSIGVNPTNNSIYVIFGDVASGEKASVKMFDGSNWVYVGLPGFSNEKIDLTSIAFNPSGTPYVAFRDFNNKDIVGVMKFDGISWVYVNSPFIVNGSQVKVVTLKINGTGDIFFACKPTSGIAVYKYNGTNWLNTGSLPYGSSAIAPNFDITLDHLGLPVLSFGDTDLSYGAGISVLRYNGSTWSFPVKRNFSATGINNPLVSADTLGNIYVAYSADRLYAKRIVAGPAVSIAAISDSICSGETTIITATGSSNYLWNTGATSNAISVTPTASTLYSITADLAGCVSYASINITVNSCVGINEYKLNKTLNLFPNPTSNILNISTEQNNFQNSQIEITNYLGQTVLKTEFKNQIDVSELASGFYTLLLKDNSGSVITKKFVKE